MSTQTLTGLSQRQLVEAWNKNLQDTLKSSDSAQVFADENDENAIMIHVDIAGRTQYSMDFRCMYVDGREVRVELLDVQEGQLHIDERSETVQMLIEDTVRHIHECAQVVHAAAEA